jgi:hypothetical protein
MMRPANIGLENFMVFVLCAVWHRLNKTGAQRHRDRQHPSVTSPALFANMFRVLFFKKDL